jgi:deazaflavin-dependent oxidoreductase (nitroreductase family)
MSLARLEQNPTIKRIGVQVLAVHQRIYERTNGRIGHRILGVPCLLLHATGAKTGQPRTTGLVYGTDGHHYYVVPSNGGADRAPSWYHNLRAHPDCHIQIGTTRIATHARTLHRDDPDFDHAWTIANAANHNRYNAYQNATTRPIPVVELTPQPT